MPTIVVPVVIGVTLEKGMRSFWARAKGEARHCGQALAAWVSRVVFWTFRARNWAVWDMEAWVIKGLMSPRIGGMTLEETVIWLRAEAEKRVRALRGL